jgi:hypothetical protein
LLHAAVNPLAQIFVITGKTEHCVARSDGPFRAIAGPAQTSCKILRLSGFAALR